MRQSNRQRARVRKPVLDETADQAWIAVGSTLHSRNFAAGMRKSIPIDQIQQTPLRRRDIERLASRAARSSLPARHWLAKRG